MEAKTDATDAPLHPIVPMPSSVDPYYDKDGITIYCGDSHDILPRLNCEVTITDPPYMIGAHSTGTEGSKAGSWGDIMNVSRWYSQWLRECKRATSQEGSIWVFGNWRSMPTYTKAFLDAGLSPTSCVVWDKEWIGPAYKNALRPTWEMILMSAMPDCEIWDRTAADVMRSKWLAGVCKTTEHAAEKPVALLERIVQLSTKEDWRVLDPFMGSGTTLVASRNCGRRAIGIEISEQWCETAVKRLSQGTLF